MEVEGPPPTQGYAVSKVCYAWIIIFKNDINLENPFSVMALNVFKDIDDFPWKVIEGEMTCACRCEIRSLSNLSGGYRIFAKIEHGEE